MSSDVDDFGFGLVVVFGFLKVKCFFFFNGNTVFKVKYLPLPDTPVRAL